MTSDSVLSPAGSLHSGRGRDVITPPRGRAFHRRTALLAALLLIGCGGDDATTPPVPENLIPVSGQVTLDGKPLPGALVLFLPPSDQDPWREARGVTNDQGNYELIYFGEHKGTVPGEHQVQITARDPNDIEKQIVPERYNAKSSLRVTVKPESGVFDFSLTSD